MRNVKTVNYNEIYLFPPSIEEWLERDHPARFIRAFVEQSDLKELGFEKPRSEEGGSYYDSGLLLRVLLYGYLKKIRSFRGMEKACIEDIGFIWLTGNQRPDHNSLWRFFSEYKKSIGLLFKQTVKVAMDMKLVGLTLQALDGTKIQSACGGRNVYDEKYLRKLEEALDKSIKQQEQSLEKSQKEDKDEPTMKLPEELKDREALQEKVKSALKQISEKEVKHSHPKELDARRMECEGRNRFSYNAQVVVDDKNQVIVAQEVTNHPNDIGLATPMMEKAAEQTQVKVQTLADGGYASSQDFAKAKEAGFSMISPLPSSWRRDVHDYHASKFEYDQKRDVVICPEGKELKFRWTRLKEGHLVRVYRDCSACKNCLVQSLCTKDRHGRTIEIGAHHQYLVEHRDLLLDERIRQKLKKRSGIVEPVFAQIKANLGFRRWSVRGLDKTATQWALLCSIWNLKVIYRAWKQQIIPKNPSPSTLALLFTQLCDFLTLLVSFITPQTQKYKFA
jgi:transposase